MRAFNCVQFFFCFFDILLLSVFIYLPSTYQIPGIKINFFNAVRQLPPLSLPCVLECVLACSGAKRGKAAVKKIS